MNNLLDPPAPSETKFSDVGGPNIEPASWHNGEFQGTIIHVNDLNTFLPSARQGALGDTPVGCARITSDVTRSEFPFFYRHVVTRIGKHFPMIDRIYWHQFTSSNEEQHIKGRQDNLIWLSSQ